MSEWTQLAQPVRCVVELDKPLVTRRERWALVQGDQNANAIVAELYQTSGVPFDLTGCTATLTFVRPDNLAVPPIQAEITENVAVSTLTDICYRVSGVYAASLRIAKNGQERTVLRLVGDVLSAENNGTVSDEQLLPTPEELLNTLIEVEQARNNAVEAANGANKAASNADSATLRANQAAAAIENITASATGLETGAEATATVTEVDGAKHFSFGIPRGEKGEKGEKGDPGNVENVTITSIKGLPEALEGKQPKGDYLPANGTAANAEKVGGKDPQYYLPAVNLLDNSDFRNPVNQRGYTVYNTVGYTIDRWLLYFSDRANFTIENGLVFNIGPNGCSFYQRISTKSVKVGEKYTLAYMLDGVISVQEWICEATENESYDIAIGISQGTHNLYWAALYEGSYTADTLPPYVPKGYGVELAECQRYFRRMTAGSFSSAVVGDARIFEIEHAGMMPNRNVDITNSVTGNQNSVASYVSGGNFPIEFVSITSDRTIVRVPDGTPGSTYVFYYEINAEL